MAFCPQCGKQVADQATKCISCGKELEPKAKGARFKGTMMMAPGAGAQGSPPSTAGSAAAKVPEAPKPAAQPVPPVPTPRVPTAGSSKVMKATMLGTGGAGLAPPGGTPHVAAATPRKEESPPAAAMPRAEPQIPGPSPVAAAETATKSATAEPEISPKLRASSQKLPEAQQRDAEDSQRFLVGDPMAPTPSPRTGRRNQGSVQNDVPVQRTGKLIAIGVSGMLVIAAVGYYAARSMGLIN